MSWKPSQQQPTQAGTEVFRDVIHAPIRVETQIQATPGYFELMKQNGQTPAEVANGIVNHYSTNISRFVDKNRQQRDIGGLDQYYRAWNAPGIEVRYGSNQGMEKVQYKTFPEKAPQEALETGQPRRDTLLDGYVYITIITQKPFAIPVPGYWVELTNPDTHMLEKYPVDFIDPDTSGDSGVPWLPFNPSPDPGAFEPDAWVVGPGIKVVTFTDVTTINTTDPFLWRLPDLSPRPGGYSLDPVPIPDFFEKATISVNPPKRIKIDGVFVDFTPLQGKSTFKFDFLIPMRTDPTKTTVRLDFGKDAVSQHSLIDEVRPKTDVLLNKIFPKLKEEDLPQYFPFWIDNSFPVGSSHLKNYIVKFPRKTLDDHGRNLFEIDSPRHFSFKAEFYDRKKYNGVTQSPHFPSGGGKKNTEITVNDKTNLWTETTFTDGKGVLINLVKPDEHTDPIGGG